MRVRDKQPIQVVSAQDLSTNHPRSLRRCGGCAPVGRRVLVVRLDLPMEGLGDRGSGRAISDVAIDAEVEAGADVAEDPATVFLLDKPL